jgi:protease IV
MRVGHGVRLATGIDESPPRAAQRWGVHRKVAVVRVEGAIASGRSRPAPFGQDGIAGAETIARLVKAAAADPEVAALVLRVDSPGGDGLASDLIWREVVQARRAGKPVVASMGDLAASGGYLVSVAADAIVAEPSTLTGSIGVFALKPDLSGLLGKLGVNPVTVKRGRHADLQSFTRGWTAEERALVEREVRAFYELFLSRVAEGRHLRRAAVEEVAEGRVWTGAQARDRGLVDALGTFEDAIRLAAARAGLPPDEEVELAAFEPEHAWFGDLAGGLGLEAEASPLASIGQLPELRALSLLLDVGPLVALPPGWLGLADPAGGGTAERPGMSPGSR